MSRMTMHNAEPLRIALALACGVLVGCSDAATADGDVDGGEGSGTVGDATGANGPSGTSASTDPDTGSGPSTADDTGPTPTDAEFTVNVTLSEVIPTVAIVTWSVDKTGLEEAHIDFGRDGDLSFSAPVDLDKPEYRTLLLGMKPSTSYDFRVVATAGAEQYQSDMQSVETGPVANGLAQLDMQVHDPANVFPGFIVSSFTATGWAFIMDADGDYVWWYESNLPMVSRARMSYDGAEMWIRDTAVGGGGPGGPGGPGGGGKIVRVTMDGYDEQVYDLPSGHHDLTVLPEGGVAYIEQDGVNCDRVVELHPDGSLTQIFNLSDAITPANTTADGCHCNSISYQADEDTYTVSSLNRNAYVRFTRNGDLVWVFGADTESTFTGDTTWQRQHGHHSLDEGRFLFFNNRAMQSTALAVEYQLDTSTMVATKTWEYDGGVGSSILGDVQELTNGNILVTYSESGVMHEVDRGGNLIREMEWSLGGATGYAIGRESLYGPSPKG